MTDKNNENQEERPRIEVVDRRMLSDEERSGATPSSDEDSAERPRLEIIDGGKTGNGASEQEASPETSVAASGSEQEDEGLTAEEEEELRAEVEQMEQEQFSALEEQIGRPLTEQEKQAVRDQMKEQARSAAALEIAPMLQQMLGEMHARATVHLGLMPNPYTRLVARNDAEARLAIDTFAALLELIKPRLEPQVEREFERVLNDLRVNFVTVTGTQPGSGPGSRIIH